MSGRKIENLVYGVDRSTNGVTERDLSAMENIQHNNDDNNLEANLVNKIAQIDIGALLNAGAQQQGPGQAQPQGQTLGLGPTGPTDINTSNIGGDLANQVAANASSSTAQGQTLGQPPAAGPPQLAAQAPPAGAPQSAAGAPTSGQGQGQGLRPAGPSDINTSNIAGDLANQLAPAPGVSGQRPASNDIGGDLANQIAGVGVPASQAQPQAQGQVAAASGGAGLVVIGVKSTIIQEANGQQIATAVIEQLGQGQQAAAVPAATGAPALAAPQAPAPPAQAPPAEAPPAEAPPAEAPPAPAPPAEAKPTEAPAAMPVPSETLIKSSAAEAASKPEAQPTPPPMAGMSGNVRISTSALNLR